MNKAFRQIKKYWKINLITFIIGFVIGVVIFCLIFFLRERTLGDAVNGTSIGGVSILFVGLLMWVSHLGAFDTITFGFRQLFSAVFSKDPIRDGTYADYKEDKAEKRSNSSYNFVAMIAAGLTIMIAVLVLEILYQIQLANV